MRYLGGDYDPDNPAIEPLDRKILGMAVALALADFNELHIVHAWSLSHENFLKGPRMGLKKAEVDALVLDEKNG